MSQFTQKISAFGLVMVVASCLLFSGCAPLLIAGGAVGGFALAKDMEDGQLIDNAPKKQENKGFFSKK